MVWFDCLGRFGEEKRMKELMFVCDLKWAKLGVVLKASRRERFKIL